MAQVNEFGYDEVVDTFTDLINAVSEFRALFGAGKKFNLMEFLGWAIKNYPNIAEVVNDFGTFWEQLKDITPDEAKAAAAQIKAGIGSDKVNDTITYVITGAAVTYSFVFESIEGGKSIVEYWRNV